MNQKNQIPQILNYDMIRCLDLSKKHSVNTQYTVILENLIEYDHKLNLTEIDNTRNLELFKIFSKNIKKEQLFFINKLHTYIDSMKTNIDLSKLQLYSNLIDIDYDSLSDLNNSEKYIEKIQKQKKHFCDMIFCKIHNHMRLHKFNKKSEDSDINIIKSYIYVVKELVYHEKNHIISYSQFEFINDIVLLYESTKNIQTGQFDFLISEINDIVQKVFDNKNQENYSLKVKIAQILVKYSIKYYLKGSKSNHLDGCLKFYEIFFNWKKHPEINTCIQDLIDDSTILAKFYKDMEINLKQANVKSYELRKLLLLISKNQINNQILLYQIVTKYLGVFESDCDDIIDNKQGFLVEFLYEICKLNFLSHKEILADQVQLKKLLEIFYVNIENQKNLENFVENSIETNDLDNLTMTLWSCLYIQSFQAKNQSNIPIDFLLKILDSKLAQNKIQSNTQILNDNHINQAIHQLKDYYKFKLDSGLATLVNEIRIKDISELKETLTKQDYIKNYEESKVSTDLDKNKQNLHEISTYTTSITNKVLKINQKQIVYLPKSTHFEYDDLHGNGFYIIDVFLSKIISEKLGKEIVYQNHLEFGLMQDPDSTAKILAFKLA